MYHVLLSNLSILVTFKRNRVINYSIKTERRDLSSSMGKIAKGIFTVALPSASHTMGFLGAEQDVVLPPRDWH